MDPLYYRDNQFYFEDGSARLAEGAQKIETETITPYNLPSFCRQHALPYCLPAAMISKAEYRTLSSSDKIAVYDIETTASEEFLFGVVSVNGTAQVFEDPRKLMEEICKYKFSCGFNSNRFDNVILAKLLPEYFKEIRLSERFSIFWPKDTIHFDALFYYQWWKPLAKSHRLDLLAEDLGIKRSFNLTDKMNKCFEDCAIVEKFIPMIKEMHNFIVKNFKLDPLAYSTMPFTWGGKLRRWMLQSYFLQNGIIPKHKTSESAVPCDYYRHCIKGIHWDVNVFDIKSMYPQTAINLQSTLYKKGDFAAYMKFLMTCRNDYPSIAAFIKFTANATIGDMGSSYSQIIKNRKIMADIWNTARESMEKLVKKIGKRKVVYSFTDSVFTKEQLIPKIKGYTIEKRTFFKWLVIYNIERILGIDFNGNIKKTHFQRKFNIKLYNHIDAIIEQKLKKNPMAFLKNPKIEINLKQIDKDLLKIILYKKGNVCRNIDYYPFWDSLEDGFHEIFLANKGVTLNPKKISYKRYQKLINDYLKLFKVDKRWLGQN